MTKLEEKLKELGYENYIYYWQKPKWVNNTFIVVRINEDLTGSLGDCIIKSQQDIDNLQQAFNEMQKDLEELKNEEVYSRNI